MVFLAIQLDLQLSPKKGKITKSELIKAPFPSMVHDFYATENYIIIPVFPLTGDFERVINGGPAFAWEPEKGTHICILATTREQPQMLCGLNPILHLFSTI